MGRVTMRTIRIDERPDFDYEAECGVHFCTVCHRWWYPMEVDDQPGECPACFGDMLYFKAGC